MSESLVIVATVALTAICSAAAPAIEREPISGTPVMVVVYTAPGLSNRMLDQAIEEATAVFEESGVLLSWTTRNRTKHVAEILDNPGKRQFPGVDPACAGFAPGACVIVQITDRFADTYLPSALGLSRPYGKDPGVVRATLFMGRISKMAARVGMPFSRLLGAVMAHELGHVLTGTDAHGEGLMRDTWTLEDFHVMCHGIQHFDTAQVRLMHLHLGKPPVQHDAENTEAVAPLLATYP